MLGTYALSSRLLRRLLRPRPAGAHEDRRGLRGRLRDGRLRRHADGADRRLRARRARPTTRWRCTSTTTSPCRCRWPASRRSRSRAGCSDGPAGRASSSPARRSARTASSTPPTRSSRRSASTARRREASTAVSAYEPVIGLEIHVQLATATKMFCGCALSLRRPAEHAHLPGLPRPAREPAGRQRRGGPLRADDRAWRSGSELAPRSIFHRKNYFYPDLPKGYQISQYDEPLCRGGRLGDVRIHRVHLEEDAAKLDPRRRERPHPRLRRRASSTSTAAARRWRRSSPSPTCARAEQAARVAAAAARDAAPARRQRREHGGGLAALRRQHLACARRAASELGTKTELKNMNSFRFIERGIRAEIARQERDPARRASRSCRRRCTSTRAPSAITSLRSKEEAHDYRYFPEPDLRPGRDHRGDARARRARRCPSCRPARAERFERELRPERRQRAAAGVPRRARRLLRGGAGRPATAPPTPQRAGQLGDQRARRAPGRRATRPSSKVAPAALAALVGAGRGQGGHARRGARRCSTSSSPSGGDPRAIVEAEGLGAIGGDGRARRRSSRRRWRPTPTSPSSCAAAT